MTEAHDPEAFAAKLAYWREHGMQVSPRASPAGRRKGAPRKPENAWERGIKRDDRGIPVLLPGTLEPMPIKKYVERRHEVDRGLRENRSSDS